MSQITLNNALLKENYNSGHIFEKGITYQDYVIDKKVCYLNIFHNQFILITSDGEIYTLHSDFVRSNGRAMNRKGKNLKFGKDPYGYYKAIFSNENIRKTFFVHRLVARAFLEDYCDELQVNHKNGIKTDNRVENLEMVTLQENIAHSIITGLKPKMKRDRFGRFCGKVGGANE